ncbi:hypothetical protein BJV78DRAFT_1133240, partial [Lactifluus subvellereus]
PRLPNEIWREIASFLPRRDLRSLLFVPHVLSSISSQLLFRRLCLQLGTIPPHTSCQRVHEVPLTADSDIVGWHAQRSAGILSRLASDVIYANSVRSLSVWAPGQFLTSANMAMLANVLPQLTNRKAFTCRMCNNALAQLFAILEKSHPKLHNLVIKSTSITPSPLPKLHFLSCFAYRGPLIGRSPDLRELLSSQTVALHTIIIHRGIGDYSTPFHSTSNLRKLHLALSIADADFVSQILSSGHQLESLWLQVTLKLGCVLSTVLRAHARPNSFPSLSEFSFLLRHVGYGYVDEDLFPAVAAFVRGAPALTALCISHPPGLNTVGYNSAFSDVLPLLINLRALKFRVPESLSFELSASLIPRSVVALELQTPFDVLLPGSTVSKIQQLLPLFPGELKFLSLPANFSPNVESVMRDCPPTVRIMCLNKCYYTIHRTDKEQTFEHWTGQRERIYVNNYLEEVDCEEIRFLYSRLPLCW